ncbi:potassium transporter Kup [Lysobacter maris]|nr:potassium transporter Kup [Lysobacter maris]AWV08205.1 potassium transporter Kup [Lysobacter maris]
MVGAMAVVFGDIGTSPLYTLKEAFSPHYGLQPNHDNVLGLLSLVFWSLMLVVALKYVTVILRADNEGEGGIMALMALAQRSLSKGSRSVYVIGLVGIFGAALFFSDGVITPAISVLAAVEGLEVVSPELEVIVIPVTLVVLIALFALQRHDTARVARLVFGPIAGIWFLTLAVLGIADILHAPEVLKAVNPLWAARFFADHAWGGIFILGAVILAVTGGEAIYTDLGRFGARPIRRAWYFFVLPSLMLNYLGQGALVLENPIAARNPFYMGVPEWGLIPLIVLSTAATVMASQAVITGGFSVAQQAMQLGYIPRMTVRHTSSHNISQIYIPGINWTMMVIVVGLVIGFGSSSALANAYGVSMSMTMLIDTVLLAVVARALWPRWRVWVLPFCLALLCIDLAFFVANFVKIPQGGWFPFALGIVLFTMLRTWRRGRKLLRAEIQKEGIDLRTFLPSLMLAPPVRVPGTAVFLTADKNVVPHAFLHNLKHNKVLHEQNVFLTVATLNVPYSHKRVIVEKIGDGFYKVLLRFGFMETPDVPLALMQTCDVCDLTMDPMDTTYFLSRESIVACARRDGMPIWRDKLFATMHRNAAPVAGYFHIPGNRLVELGTQVEI